MLGRAATVEALLRARVVPVLRLGSAADLQFAVEALIEAGAQTVEVTLTTPGAIEVIAQLRISTPPSFVIGAGTVLDLDTAAAVIKAGADYLVSPFAFEAMVRVAHAADRAALPAGFTPTEVLACHRAQADIVKVFPAGSAGPAHLAALKSVFPFIKLCPTGGVSASNAAEYLRAGASIVGMGNNIIDARALAGRDRAAVVAHARRVFESVREAVIR